MKKVRPMAKPVSFIMAIVMIGIFTPCQTVLAKMISVETLQDAGRVEDARTFVNSVLSRDEVTASIVARGIDVHEAMARIDAMSDAEIIALADRMEQLPAGGSAFGTIVGAAVIVFIVLLITDIMGFTDIFPFVKKHH
jgi:hypothetical protein